MPRTGPSHLKKTFKAQHIFTDREEPRETFKNALSKPQENDEYRILNFHGVGGQGKTALCEQFTIIAKKERQGNDQLGWAKLDFEVSEQRMTANALLSIRLQLAKRCKIPFPAFDTAFARHFAFSQPGRSIRDTYPELFSEVNDVLKDVESVLGDLVKEVPGAGLFFKYGKKLSNFANNWWQRRGKDILKDLDELDQHKLLEALPIYLGADLYDWLFEKKSVWPEEKRRLVLLIDTYEALWREQPTKSGIEAMRVDAWIRKLVENTPGILYVMLGRDKLNWSEIEPEWDADIASHLLGELSKEDADKFLRQVPIEESEVRAVIVESSQGLPFYLDLQVDLYEKLKQQATSPSPSNFGGKAEQIRARFTDHLDENIRRALQVLSHARFVDEDLARHLAQEFLGGQASINFKMVTYYSFWRQQGSTWHMHSLMREYLQDRLRQDEPKLFKSIHQCLFEYYNSRIENLEQVIGIDDSHKLALTEAGYHLEQFEDTNFPKWLAEKSSIFAKAYAWTLVQPLLEHALVVAEMKLGKDHEMTAASLNNLAALYQSQGEYKKAEPFFLRSLEIRKKALGENHSDVATSLNNLAALYDSQGEYGKAEPFFLRSLEIRKKALGENHSDVATSLNNLAALYQSQGEYKKAEPFFLRSLEILKKALGEDHPDVATSLNNLAGLYQSQGEYGKAEPFFLRSLEIRKKALGEDHPDVAASLNNLAGLYQSQGEYGKAEPLYLGAIAILEIAFPEGHPNLDTVKSNYSQLIQMQEPQRQGEENDNSFDVNPNRFENVPRNSLCPCRSGRRYKYCCGQ